MEKMSKDQVIAIANNILNTSDIIGKHGTSIANANSIVETGFNYDKTSIAVQKGKSIIGLCSYGWKENAADDTTNVIIAIPKSFVMMLNDFSEEDYNNWIETIRTQDLIEGLFDSVSSVVETREAYEGKSFGKFAPPRLPSYVKRHIPREFIKGFFVWCDGKRYIDYLPNPEESLEHLTYFESPYFFDNLSLEDQENFVASFHEARSKSK